jgi:3-isopropylmalate/(R)-2-methylmalate dehydratase large subunit
MKTANMGMTITEKILAAHSDLDEVHPGELIKAKVDIALGNDITAPLAIDEFEKAGAQKVFDQNKIVLIPDHFTPNKDIKSAQLCSKMRQFAKAHGLRHYYEVGRTGIEHAFLPEQGLVLPGDLIMVQIRIPVLMAH